MELKSDLASKINRIDDYLIIPKALFFLVNLILYITYTYQLDYIAKVWKLNITSSGLISSIPIISFFCAIAWANLAQRTGWYKEIIVFVSCVYSLSFSCLYFLSHPLQAHSYWIRFTVVMVIYSVMSVMASALFPLLDHKMYAKLSRDCRFTPEIFGRQRLWGTLGQGISGYVAGHGIKNFGYGSLFIYSSVASIVFIALVLVGFENSHPDSVEKKQVDASPACQKPSWTQAMTKLLSLRFICFLLVVLMASYARAIVGNFLVRFLSVVLDASQERSGLIILIRTLPEITCYYFSKNFLSSFGVYNMLLMAQLAGLIRVATYGWLPKHWIWAPFFVESLRGVNNAFMMASGVRLAHELSPVESQTVAQGFFHGIFGNLTSGVAGIVSSLISVYINSVYPGSTEAQIIRVIFQTSAYASIFGLAVFILFVFVSQTKPVLKY